MKYDYLILLCADKKDPNGEFPDFRNGDYIGGKNRMDAALQYSLAHPYLTYIVSGGFDPDNGDNDPIHSQKVEDMVDFLKDGNPTINIIQIPSLPCIRHNFIAILNKMHDALVGKRIAILTSFIYLPRTYAIWSKLGDEFDNLPNLHAICSESLINNDKVILSNIDMYMKRLSRETHGLQALENGIYKDFCLVTSRDKYMKIAQKYPYLTSPDEKKLYSLS